MTLKGIPEMVAKLNRILGKFPDEVARALFQEASIEMTEAKRRTPWDTGVLKASGYVQEPVRQGKKISVTLGFGGAAEGYALIVHENLESYHPHGQAKYLESVLKESSSHMAFRLGKRIDMNRIAKSA